MVTNRGLEKGLDAKYFSREVSLKETVSHEVFLSIHEIEPRKDQPRKIFDEDSLQELAHSIKQYTIAFY